jgi:hypothetical protein
VNVFVLSTGRCGSTTIARAFAHATNLTAAHESPSSSYYPLDYPDDHLESDNRLSWMLGELGERFPEARYIHLIRAKEEVAASFAARPDYPGASIRGFGAGILGRGDHFMAERYECADRMWDVVNANIREFLREREHRTVWLFELSERLPELWAWLGCEGDLAAAVAESRVRHNARDLS